MLQLRVRDFLSLSPSFFSLLSLTFTFLRSHPSYPLGEWKSAWWRSAHGQPLQDQACVRDINKEVLCLQRSLSEAQYRCKYCIAVSVIGGFICRFVVSETKESWSGLWFELGFVQSCPEERIHAALTPCRNFLATTGGLSELESNPANPARNTVIKTASLCRHCHTQPLPPAPTRKSPSRAAITHTIPSRSGPSRVIGVLSRMK